MGILEILKENLVGSGGPAAVEETAEERDSRMAWWREARFGMFLHWGLYSIPGGYWKGIRAPHKYSEWIMCSMMIPDKKYSKLAAEFDPSGFDAAEWVRVAKSTGMKYLVITSKHHDGFCLFDSALTEYTSVKASPFGRDVIAELAAVCADQGVRFGIYYSLLDWHHSYLPGFFGVMPDFDRYVDYMKSQLEELLTKYGPVSVLFFDGDWMLQWTGALGAELERFCRSIQPGVIINNRIGKRPKLADFKWAEKLAMNTTCGDYETPEQYVLDNIPPRDWETCMTMNNSWGWHRKDENWKSTDELIGTLRDVLSKGGNYLLNVGPTGDGVIPAPCVERLEKIGGWIKENGAAIYVPGPVTIPAYAES